MQEYIKDEQRSLKRELVRAQEEVKRIQSVPLVIGQFLEPIDQQTGIVGSTTGSNYVVRILSTLDRELLKPSSSVALHRHSNALVDILPPEADSSIAMLGAHEKPDVSYADVGGLDMQKQELREAVELPLTHGDLYRQIGIDPPRGVLLYGPPGTGKTMLVKAVANSTTASFIRVVGSEFVQKYLGEGPRMVRDVFRLARENSPSIIFIDEIDAIATKRFDAQTGADREVQRILLELLNQMDGFDQQSSVKVYSLKLYSLLTERLSWLLIERILLIPLFYGPVVSIEKLNFLGKTIDVRNVPSTPRWLVKCHFLQKSISIPLS
jgi:26S proteasome regulatory subunit T3